MAKHYHEADVMQNLVLRLETATKPDRQIDAEIHALFFGETQQNDIPDYTGSTDAALLLTHGWNVSFTREGWENVARVWNKFRTVQRYGAQPSLAIAAAMVVAKTMDQPANV